MVLRTLSSRKFFYVKAALFILMLLPAVLFAIKVQGVADPVEFLTKETGEFALRFLVLTLMVTPFVRLSGWNWLVKLRRMFGLYVFFYVALHFSTYIFLDLQLDFSLVVDDIIKRKYITVGFAAFLMLIPLAITSNDRLIRKIGARRWTRLHRLVYIIAPLAVLHFFWQVRGNDWGEPLFYFSVVALLLVLRLPPIAMRIKRRR